MGPVKRWEVVWIGYSHYAGMGMGPAHEPHEKARKAYRTWLGADWSRRFSNKHRWITATMGTFQTSTMIVRVGTPWTPELELSVPPRYADFLAGGRFDIWKPAYWARNHWEGLRFGYDRDVR